MYVPRAPNDLLFKVNPPKEGLFQSKQGSFGFQVCIDVSTYCFSEYICFVFFLFLTYSEVSFRILSYAYIFIHIYNLSLHIFGSLDILLVSGKWQCVLGYDFVFQTPPH